MSNNSKIHSAVLNIVYSPLVNKLISMVGGQILYTECHIRRKKRQRLVEAKKEFKNGSSFGNFNDYKQALKKHWVSYKEYAEMYEFYKKTEAEREEYVSLLKVAYFYRRYNNGVVLPILRDKQRFLKTYSKYIHREWLYAPESSFEQFEQLITKYDCIVKPCDEARGKGVFKIYKEADHSKDKALYESCVKNRMVVEQCIEACDELKAFHPQSLNTIRVVTIAGKEKACVFSGVFRSGVGDNVVDNTHAGGVSAQINPQSGIIETDGADSKGNKFVCHPDSGIQFKGYKIPQWDRIVENCCTMAKEVKNPITGWDVVINKQGQVEFIEANYGPDLDVMQVRYGHGIKRNLYALIKEYCGIEMK
jgi:hypothetical protein